MTKTPEERTAGLTAQRYAQLVEQRRYETNVGAEGLEALLAPYAVSSSELRIPAQRRPEEDE